MEFLTLGVVTKKSLDLLRNFRGGQYGAVLTQLAAVAVAVAYVVLVAHSSLTQLQHIAGIDLARVNTATQVLLGLGVGIGGSGIISDAVKAIDASQTAAHPNLLTGELPTVIGALTPVVGEAVAAPAPTKRTRTRKA